ncbi:hypothetical protein SEA_VROOMVROOM_54 [Arthrobacter phage VroomVroom]|uniref:Uncharacterized protein n=1 Tax=Arthrobacter phage VroomVroom TaxID=3049371 RepID=A0AA49IPY7_9CAUD|nr:hypothetical protein SEA_VROOMVROOM_54 [Arthrobacter phage VroomVroom]
MTQPNEFTYQDADMDELEIHTAKISGETKDDVAFIYADSTGVYVPRKDAPRVARALLKAAGSSAMVLDMFDTAPPIPIPAVTLTSLPKLEIKFPYARPLDRYSFYPEAPLFADLPAEFAAPSPAAETLDDCVYVDEDGDRMIIEDSGEDGAYVKAYDSGVNVAREDAPEIALAILERAGWTEKNTRIAGDAHDVAMARHYLRTVVDRTAKARAQDEAEKAEEAALDAEALKLYNGAYGLSSPRWSAHIDNASRERWRNAARAARQMHLTEAAK